jgi:hypothetical protein
METRKNKLILKLINIPDKKTPSPRGTSRIENYESIDGITWLEIDNEPLSPISET